MSEGKTVFCFLIFCFLVATSASGCYLIEKSMTDSMTLEMLSQGYEHRIVTMETTTVTNKQEYVWLKPEQYTP